MSLPVVIHKDKNSDYGVTVPDLSGFFSAGKSMEEALELLTILDLKTKKFYRAGIVEDVKGCFNTGVLRMGK